MLLFVLFVFPAVMLAQKDGKESGLYNYQLIEDYPAGTHLANNIATTQIKTNTALVRPCRPTPIKKQGFSLRDQK